MCERERERERERESEKDIVDKVFGHKSEIRKSRDTYGNEDQTQKRQTKTYRRRQRTTKRTVLRHHLAEPVVAHLVHQAVLHRVTRAVVDRVLAAATEEVSLDDARVDAATDADHPQELPTQVHREGIIE